MLFRTSHHSAQLELELTRRNIPYVKFGGLKFLEAAHVKDLLSILRFAENPRDRVSGFRVLQLMPGIGATTAEGILDRLDAMAGCRAAGRPPRAATGRRALGSVRAAVRALAARQGRLAGRDRSGASLV